MYKPHAVVIFSLTTTCILMEMIVPQTHVVTEVLALMAAESILVVAPTLTVVHSVSTGSVISRFMLAMAAAYRTEMDF